MKTLEALTTLVKYEHQTLATKLKFSFNIIILFQLHEPGKCPSKIYPFIESLEEVVQTIFYRLVDREDRFDRLSPVNNEKRSKVASAKDKPERIIGRRTFVFSAETRRLNFKTAIWLIQGAHKTFDQMGATL